MAFRLVLSSPATSADVRSLGRVAVDMTTILACSLPAKNVLTA
jgi:hypothetical protein